MIAQINQPYGFNYTALDQDDSIFVQAAIYDVTAGFPGTLFATVNMVLTTVGSYDGLHTFSVSGKLYKIAMTVYTDGTYTVVDPDRAPLNDMVQTVDLSGGSNTTTVVTVDALRAQVIQPAIVVAQFIGEEVEAQILEE